MQEQNNNEKNKVSIKESAQKTYNDIKGLTIAGIFRYLRYLLDLRQGSDEELTKEEIQSNIEFRGANLWILAFSIFIASIGLNTNSAAVVIGAMLISPLMGPIMGIGLAVGINDFEMLKRSLKSLSVAVLIAVLTSTIYFVLSPLSEAQSELLARTKPTFYDVLIAIFGGLSGIVGASRKLKGNVIPGVAIATALMPPLCTAGYGIATGNFNYFFGAFYLFFINSVFISLSTIVIVRILKFKQKAFVDKEKEKKATRYILAFVFITVLPSFVIGYGVVREEFLRRQTLSYIEENFNFKGTRISYYDLNFDSDTAKVIISLDGKILSEDRIEELKMEFARYDVGKYEIEIYQDNDPTADIDKRIEDRLRTGMTETLYKKNEELLKDKDKKIAFLEEELVKWRSTGVNINAIAGEVKFAFPAVKTISYANLLRSYTDKLNSDTIPTVMIEIDTTKSLYEESLKNWLKQRLGFKNLDLISKPFEERIVIEKSEDLNKNDNTLLDSNEIEPAG